MAGGITDSRLALGAALEAAGLRVTFDPGIVAPPAVLIAPESPWVSPAALGIRRRQLRWRVIAVAGRADVAVTLTELEDLVAAVILAMAELPRDWGTPVFDAPGTIELPPGGPQYLGAVGRTDHHVEV